MNFDFWRGRSVFLTGHTGFKGTWIALWLTELGAKVHGYSLAPSQAPNVFSETRLRERLQSSTIADIRDLPRLSQAIADAKPSIVIHMAAQSLVLHSYVEPVDTFSTNVIGTVNLLEAARRGTTVEAIINVTTDKCYENNEWVWSYRENDRLGGKDPYSNSKACSELVTFAYRNSFFADSGVQVSSARAGNVIGGGDWAIDRLIPDYLRAADAGRTLVIRAPDAVRPWQHVLEPLSGYIDLAESLIKLGPEFAQAWNFGPNDSDAKPVSWILEYLSKKIPNVRFELDISSQRREAQLLKLDSSKAREKLGWRPRWSLATAIDKTVEWHQAWREGQSMAEISTKQIRDYQTI